MKSHQLEEFVWLERIGRFQWQVLCLEQLSGPHPPPEKWSRKREKATWFLVTGLHWWAGKTGLWPATALAIPSSVLARVIGWLCTGTGEVQKISKPQCHRFLSCCYGQRPSIDVNCALHAATLQLHAYKSLMISTAVSSNLQLHTCKASSSLQLLCIGIFMQSVCTNCNHKQLFNSDQVFDISYVSWFRKLPHSYVPPL